MSELSGTLDRLRDHIRLLEEENLALMKMLPKTTGELQTSSEQPISDHEVEPEAVPAYLTSDEVRKDIAWAYRHAKLTSCMETENAGALFWMSFALDHPHEFSQIVITEGNN